MIITMDEFGHVEYGEGSGLEIVFGQVAGTHELEDSSLRLEQQEVEHTWQCISFQFYLLIDCVTRRETLKSECYFIGYIYILYWLGGGDFLSDNNAFSAHYYIQVSQYIFTNNLLNS